MTEWTLDTLKEHFEAIHKKDQESLRLQAIEYERRLADLNHEYDRITQLTGRMIERGTYEIQHKMLVDRVERIENVLAESAGKAKGIGTAAGLFYATLLALAAATSIWVGVFVKLR